MHSKAEDFFASLKFLRKNLELAEDDVGRTAVSFLDVLAGKVGKEKLPDFLEKAVDILHAEIEAAAAGGRAVAFAAFENMLSRPGSVEDGGKKAADAFWAVMFPEALHLDADPDKQIEKLRKLRTVTIQEPCADSIIDPAGQVIFTSNVLLSPPTPDTNLSDSEALQDIVEGAEKVAAEKQLYWYDHPVPIGVPAANDEAVYGLRGLSEMLKYEKLRGGTDPSARMDVVLSVSVTHQGLREWALPWLKTQLAEAGEELQEGLNVYAFTEENAAEVIDILSPWLPAGLSVVEMKETFGVDGEYGRHYSFLKAFPALWGVFSGGKKKATFKIDLDQVFPQDVLAAETGKSTFEHFRTPLWGAKAADSEGKDIELGMIAGALVNEKDIGAGLFTPDIPWPSGIPEGEDMLFFKLRPMAVSTRAELMTRYGSPGFPDGVNQALQRIHVTGGTNGIRFDALRRHRPFTPSFVGRAEDQAYILSVLTGNGIDGRNLAYAHASGLFMRHDKEAFATDAVKAGKAGSYVGDLVRLFVFSTYARMLPGGAQAIKAIVDPFTGCFITPMPATLAFLRLALHLMDEGAGSEEERVGMLNLATIRLEPWLSDSEGMRIKLKESFEAEKKAWNGYYDALENLEKGIQSESPEAKKASNDFSALLERCRVAG